MRTPMRTWKMEKDGSLREAVARIQGLLKV
jgi:hypothetical protein